MVGTVIDFKYCSICFLTPSIMVGLSHEHQIVINFYLTSPRNQFNKGALVLTDSRSAPLLTTPRALDSPSGEQSYRSPLTDALPPFLSRRTHGALPDTPVPSRSQVRFVLFSTSCSLFIIKPLINLRIKSSKHSYDMSFLNSQA
jgi:hypothetical protein